MHPPHIPKMLIKKSCLLWIRMVLENFYQYKKKPKQTKNRLFVSSWEELYKQISLENYHSTWNLIKLMLFAQPIVIILVYWPCHWLELSPPRFLLFPGPIFSQLCPCHVPVHVIYWWSNTLSTAASDVQNVIRISFLC